jgi:pimeloyl-ACP methyl ester carboxylesterase
MSHRFVDVPGGRLHVTDEGTPTDPPVVLLHAAIADSRAWDDVVPLLAAGGYRVVRRDMRGFGQTVTEDVEFSHRADVIAVLDALGIDRAVLIGNSAGGQIAFDTAIEFPDRAAAVVGVGAGLGGFDGGATPEEMAAFDEADAIETAFDEGGPDAPSAAELVDIEVRFWVDGIGQSPDRVPSAIREAVRAMNLLHYSPARANGTSLRLTPPAAERLAELRCPILAVAGELDVSDVAATARHLEANVPGARAVVWPDVAHMIGMEQPARLADLVLEFLAPLPRWS